MKLGVLTVHLEGQKDRLRLYFTNRAEFMEAYMQLKNDKPDVAGVSGLFGYDTLTAQQALAVVDEAILKGEQA